MPHSGDPMPPLQSETTIKQVDGKAEDYNSVIYSRTHRGPRDRKNRGTPPIHSDKSWLD